MRDSLSVLLPARNSQAVLERQVLDILEVLSELTRRLEVLIIDDGSDDGTEEISWDLAARFTQVEYIRHPFPLGMTEALRTGYSATAGDYLLIHMDLARLNVEDLARCWLSRNASANVPSADSVSSECRDGSGQVEPGWLQRLTKWGREMLANQPESPSVTPMRLIRRHELTDLLVGRNRSTEIRWDPGTKTSPRPQQTARAARRTRQALPTQSDGPSYDAPLGHVPD